MKSLSLVLALLINFNAFAEDSPVGIWIVSSADAKIEIFKKDDELQGKIIWIKEPLDKSGLPKLDVNNPEEKLRTAPILGMVLLKGFSKDEKEKRWSGGTIYDAKSGKTYKAWMQTEGEKKLKLRGYVGISLFGRTEEWTRIVD